MENCFGAIVKFRVAIILALLGLCRPALTQEVSAALLPPDAPSAVMEPAPFTTSVPSTPAPEAHEHRRFWDRENSILFATSAAFSAADFVVTKDNLQGGGRELNPVTRIFGTSTAGLAMNFAGETAGVVGLSYVFHKTGHHKLERAVSMLNISSSAVAVSFDLTHR
jgi:hypothetical protein